METSKIIAKKCLIRNDILDKRRSMPKEEVFRKSEIIKERLFSLKQFLDGNVILFYASICNEVDTKEFIKKSLMAGKRVLLPIVEQGWRLRLSEVFLGDRNLKKGMYGIPVPNEECMRPVPADQIDVVIVPGIAFDKYGGRIGFGKGYYDRFLASLPTTVETIGICFDFQIMEKIDLVENDFRIKRLISETKCIICKKGDQIKPKACK